MKLCVDVRQQTDLWTRHAGREPLRNHSEPQSGIKSF